MIDSAQAWSAKTKDVNQWMVIDAGSAVSVAGIAVQSRSADGCCGQQYVTAIKVYSSPDNTNWTAVDGGQEF